MSFKVMKDNSEEKFSDTSDSSTKSSSSKSKPRQYKQTYRKAWETVPDFKGWLRAVPGQPSRAFCKFCNKTLHAHRLTLLKHTCTLKHSKNAQTKFSQNKEATDKGQTKRLSLKPSMIAYDVPVDALVLDISSVENSEVEDEPQLPKPAEEPPPEIQTKKPEDVAPVSTHVLDTAKGMPCSGLHLSLYKLIDGRWTHISDSSTNPVGRCDDLITREDLKPGRFKLHFDVHRYYELRNQDSTFPFIEIAFDVRSSIQNYHIPLLLSPYGFTTYRGKL